MTTKYSKITSFIIFVISFTDMTDNKAEAFTTLINSLVIGGRDLLII